MIKSVSGNSIYPQISHPGNILKFNGGITARGLFYSAFEEQGPPACFAVGYVVRETKKTKKNKLIYLNNYAI